MSKKRSDADFAELFSLIKDGSIDTRNYVKKAVNWETTAQISLTIYRPFGWSGTHNDTLGERLHLSYHPPIMIELH